MITIRLPYDIGTFVKVLTKSGEVDYLGTIAAYTVTNDGWLAWVSGYKEAVTGEYLPSEIEQMTDEEIEVLIKQKGE